MHRPVLKTLTASLLAALAACAPAYAADVSVSAVPDGRPAVLAPGAKPQAVVRLRTCQSAAYYDGRLIAFRSRMARFSDTSAPQTLQMRFDVFQRYAEKKKFSKLKAAGLGTWFSSSTSATLYQRDLSLTNIETMAYFKLRVTFRWLDESGAVQARRTITSEVCKQKRKLPALRIANMTAVPVAGSTDLQHTLTVTNSGGSEAMDMPVAVATEAGFFYATIESIGPKQSVDVQLRVPACTTAATAYIDPQRTQPRMTPRTGLSWVVPRCR